MHLKVKSQILFNPSLSQNELYVEVTTKSKRQEDMLTIQVDAWGPGVPELCLILRNLCILET